ncbi:hypothetical protein M0813_24988 [Anaeramoeba flamelloides]|uniref:Uncharacterized protein n=1 Tax=Anaeramoeba flamelloides TaxID=1746091 RepID=A0ABQ8Y7B7_9EUKA|nr:hypothetical protein M0813_24988 [Anaeramoeba flamelloides]
MDWTFMKEDLLNDAKSIYNDLDIHKNSQKIGEQLDNLIQNNQTDIYFYKIMKHHKKTDLEKYICVLQDIILAFNKLKLQERTELVETQSLIVLNADHPIFQASVDSKYYVSAWCNILYVKLEKMGYYKNFFKSEILEKRNDLIRTALCIYVPKINVNNETEKDGNASNIFPETPQLQTMIQKHN